MINIEGNSSVYVPNVNKVNNKNVQKHVFVWDNLLTRLCIVNKIRHGTILIRSNNIT